VGYLLLGAGIGVPSVLGYVGYLLLDAGIGVPSSVLG
jgi:hypothetical protein